MDYVSGKMLDNDPVVDSLLAENPFFGQDPPRYIRARHYKYMFTALGSPEASAGQWWNRELVGEYLPTVDKAALKPIYRQFGWKSRGRSNKPKQM